MAKELFIVTGATYWVLKDGTRYATGYWAEEFANPYKILTDAGHEVVVATPNGVTPNVDMMSLRPEMVGGIQAALELEAIIRSAEAMRRPLRCRTSVSRTTTRCTCRAVTARCRTWPGTPTWDGC